MRLIHFLFITFVTSSLHASQTQIANVFVNCVSRAVENESKTSSFAKIKESCIANIKHKNGVHFSDLNGVLVPPSLEIQVLEESSTSNSTYMKVLVKYDAKDIGRILLGSFGRGVDLYGPTAGGGSNYENANAFGSSSSGGSNKNNNSVNVLGANGGDGKNSTADSSLDYPEYEITEERVSSKDFCRKRTPGQSVQEVLNSGNTFGRGFTHVEGECVRMCPAGTVYRGRTLNREFDPVTDCITCENDPHAVPWVTAGVRTEFVSTPQDQNRCADEDGCSMGQSLMTWPDGSVRCSYNCCFGETYNNQTKQCESLPNYCAENTARTRNLAVWSNMEKLRSQTYGACSGERLYTLALIYKSSFEFTLQDNQSKCHQEQSRLSVVRNSGNGWGCSNYIPPTFNMQQVFKENCNPTPQPPPTNPQPDTELYDLIRAVGSIPAYDGIIE